MIRVTESITLDDDELQEEFIRSSGPGGQHVNKAATGVQLRFDAAGSPSLPEEVRDRLIRLARGRVTDEGVVIIEAKRYRSQDRNRKDALDRLVKLIQAAAVPPKPRKKSRTPPSSRRKRLEEKHKRGQRKRLRRRVKAEED
ncbi:MAG: alternative ribosome rescue aminoacyl-tRNA hydrolase ArfB [Candidatus Hydrogenedentes bacterium]|nr:alternative ribosome rescue aminoacyl-tRNA hydrolase ArfB [Candidatus Hydrogenedentota bacterium]